MDWADRSALGRGLFWVREQPNRAIRLKSDVRFARLKLLTVARRIVDGLAYPRR